MNARDVFKRGNAEEWTLARIGELSVQEIKQLRDNAERLNEPSVVELCQLALQDARSSRGRTRRKSLPRTKARRLIARVSAFEARGVFLQDARTSWSGVRKPDGRVVMALWADAVETAECWALALSTPQTPSVIALTREGLPTLRRDGATKQVLRTWVCTECQVTAERPEPE